MFLFYNWPFLHACILQGKLIIFHFNLGSVFGDYVDFCGNCGDTHTGSNTGQLVFD